MAKQPRFRFRNVDKIGTADAEGDSQFLEDCFVDTGHLDVLRDCSDPKCIILGRTGAGKTALIGRLREAEERAIEIRPESLSLGYISNSTILRFFSDINVRLDIFYKLLWRHVFIVEIIKRHFNIDSERAKKTFVERIRDIFRNERDRRALKYLEDWSGNFWEETEYRIKEVTKKLEDDLAAGLAVKFPGLAITLDAASKFSADERQEIAKRGQDIVNRVQMRELSEILDLIDSVLDDPQKRYFIVIDRLDEDWVDDSFRYRLIRALIETVRDFRKVRRAKIVVALRVDLLDRVIRLTRDSGFQEEKLEALYLHILWTREQLLLLLDKRIQKLVRYRYTAAAVAHRDILPKSINKQDGAGYFLERTLLRPRDVIMLFNECIAKAANQDRFNARTFREAEGEYSRGRLRSLADEWSADYPNLLPFAMILKNGESSFFVGNLEVETCELHALDLATQGFQKHDLLSQSATAMIEGTLPKEQFRALLIGVFYKVSLIGLKFEKHEPFIWSISGRRAISTAEITSLTLVRVHPMFWRVLGVRESDS